MALSVGLTQLIDLGALGITGYPFTLAGWFRVPNVNKLLTLMGVGNSVTGSYHRLLFQGHTTNNAAAISFVTTTSTAVSATAMVPGTWHHVVGVFEAANLRRVYLDGGNLGTNSASRPFDGLDRFYLGNLGTDTVDVADVAVFDVALNGNHVATLAKGLSPLVLPVADRMVAYQNCLRRLNWPAFGPAAVAAATPPVVPHPRVFLRRNRSSRTLPYRLRGPFHNEQAMFQTAGLLTGQQQIAGVSGREGQVSVAGLTAGAAGLSGEVQS
jgi:hypothetical protein